MKSHSVNEHADAHASLSITSTLLLISTSLIMIFTSNTARTADDLQQVPLFDEGVLIRVPVNAFGKTLYFMVDTGFTFSAIDAVYKPLLGECVTASFHGESSLGTDTSLPVFRCPEINLAGKPFALQTIACLDLQMLSLISGQQCDGILGADFFAKQVVSIDFDRRSFSFLPAVPAIVKHTFVAIPLQQAPHYYTTEVIVNCDKALTLMVDTGDNSSISLNADAWLQIFGDGKTNTTAVNLSDASAQVAKSKVGLIDHLRIGTLNYTGLHATRILNPTNPSHLGLGFFRRHKTIFDFESRMLYVEPGMTFSTSDKEDMSGLHLLRDHKTTFVYSVDENSPAFAIGIKPKDIIEFINGQEADSLTMKSIREMLQSHDGERVSIKVRRGNNALELQFALKKAL